MSFISLSTFSLYLPLCDWSRKGRPSVNYYFQITMLWKRQPGEWKSLHVQFGLCVMYRPRSACAVRGVLMEYNTYRHLGLQYVMQPCIQAILGCNCVDELIYWNWKPFKQIVLLTLILHSSNWYWYKKWSGITTFNVYFTSVDIK